MKEVTAYGLSTIHALGVIILEKSLSLLKKHNEMNEVNWMLVK